MEVSAEVLSALRIFLLEVSTAKNIEAALLKAEEMLLADGLNERITPALIKLAAWYAFRTESIADRFTLADRALMKRLPGDDRGVFLRTLRLKADLENSSPAGRELLSLLLRVVWEVSTVEKNKRKEVDGSGARSL